MITSHTRKPYALYASHHKEASIIPKRPSETGCFKYQVSNVQFCKHLLKSRDILPTQVLRSLRSNQMGETSILEFYVLPKEFLAFCYVDNSPKALWVKVPYHCQQLNSAAWLWALSHPSLRAFLLPSMAPHMALLLHQWVCWTAQKRLRWGLYWFPTSTSRVMGSMLLAWLEQSQYHHHHHNNNKTTKNYMETANSKKSTQSFNKPNYIHGACLTRSKCYGWIHLLILLVLSVSPCDIPLSRSHVLISSKNSLTIKETNGSHTQKGAPSNQALQTYRRMK